MMNFAQKERIENAITELLYAIGEDPSREGLRDTPKRVANMYEEVFEGIQYSNEDIAKKFNKTFEEDILNEAFDDMVIIKDIPIFSYCEHHIALMYNMSVSVAYIPKGKVIGLSKVARIAEMVGKRLQLQERIGKDMSEIIQMVTGSSDVAVIIKGEHSCMTSRGIKKPGSNTVTSTLNGHFRNPSAKNELMMLLSQ
jgi:GTP cyclohydrolase I